MLQHKHLIVRAEVGSPPFDTARIENWLRQLVSDLGMNIMMGPISGYSPVVGNRGLTAAVVIETSHIVLHAWDEDEPAMLQLDVYTCSELNPDVIWNAMQEFDPVKIEYKLLDREHGLHTLAEFSS